MGDNPDYELFRLADSFRFLMKDIADVRKLFKSLQNTQTNSIVCKQYVILLQVITACKLPVTTPSKHHVITPCKHHVILVVKR